MIVVTLDWADGTYPFKLGLKQLQELQEKCNAGPEMIRFRVAQGFPNVMDVRETIRLGLIGGGLEAVKALNLVRTYADDAPRIPNHAIALAILGACLVGVPDDPVGKSQAVTDGPTGPALKTESGPSPSSTV